MLRRAASMGPGYRLGEAAGSCTESLGSESGDVGCDAEIVDQAAASAAATAALAEVEVEACPGRLGSQESPEKRRRLPPAMPRAADAFMRAERRGGRLILTEVVRAERREVFRASRADGRLQLRFAEAPDGARDVHAEPAPPETESVAGGGGLVISGCCCSGGGFRQVAAGAGRRLEIGAAMGI